MDIVILERLLPTLQENLEIIRNAWKFYKETSIDIKISNFSPLEVALHAYYYFERNKNEFKKFIMSQQATVLSIGQDGFFSTEADKLIKDTDARLNTICREISISPPEKNQYDSSSPSMKDWGFKVEQNIAETLNIMDVASQIISDVSDVGDNIGSQLDEGEREMILKAIRNAGGSKAKAAKMLGIPRSSLYSKLKKLSITDV